jgi:hypothetical protein
MQLICYSYLLVKKILPSPRADSLSNGRLPLPIAYSVSWVWSHKRDPNKVLQKSFRETPLVLTVVRMDTSFAWALCSFLRRPVLCQNIMMSLTSTVLHGHEVSVAPLETIDFARLASKDPFEISRLLRCCETHGFFYLDLQGTDSARQVISDEKDVLRFMETYFDQPQDEKRQGLCNARVRSNRSFTMMDGIVDTRD